MRSLIFVLSLSLSACAVQAPYPSPTDSQSNRDNHNISQQELLAALPAEPTLKRKIAVGRLSNETTYGRSMLRASLMGEHDDKISDMFLQSVMNTNAFLVFERPDLSLVQNELALQGQSTDQIVGVDTLVVGSLTEFGRSTTGKRGFFTTSQQQVATATVDLRLVDVNTGRVLASYTGTGDSSIEQSRVLGFGTVAGYDGSINDRAIGAAVNAAVAQMAANVLSQPWSADILTVQNDRIYMSGGEAQGVKPDMTFAVYKKGENVRSATTGATIQLPRERVATLRVQATFGDDLMNQGSYGTLIEGSIEGIALADLEVRVQ